MFRRMVILAGFCLTCVLYAQDVLSDARALAKAGKDNEAYALLERHLEAHPDDPDARLVYALILSWNGRLAQSRMELERVLRTHPDYADVSLALINVETSTGNLDRADHVSFQALARDPESQPLLVARAKVLRKMGRREEAARTLDLVLKINPKNDEARDLRRLIRQEDPGWRTGITYNMIRYRGQSTWNEQSVSMRRGTYAGSFLFRASRAYRFGETANLFEADWYPVFRDGTYAYVNGGFSPGSTGLYPRYRGAFELFQSLGKGFEASAGINHLSFPSTGLTYFTGSFGRYYRSWYGSLRTYLTPDRTGVSRTLQIQGRRYFGDGQRYIGCRYSFGSGPVAPGVANVFDTNTLRTTSTGCETNWQTFDRLFLNFYYGVGSEDFQTFGTQRRNMLSLSMYFKY